MRDLFETRSRVELDGVAALRNRFLNLANPLLRFGMRT